MANPKRKQLRRARLALGLTKEEMAKRVGVCVGVITGVESTKMPQPRNIVKLAEGYKIEVKEFITFLLPDEE